MGGRLLERALSDPQEERDLELVRARDLVFERRTQGRQIATDLVRQRCVRETLDKRNGAVDVHVEIALRLRRKPCAPHGIFVVRALRELDVELHAPDAVRIVRDDELEDRSEEHTSELQSRGHLVCRLLLEKKKIETSLCGI